MSEAPEAQGTAIPLLRYGLTVAAIVLVLDQASKLWIVFSVMTPPRVIEVFDFFRIVMVWNRGVSFGIGGDGALPPWVLGGFAIAVAILIGYWLTKAENRYAAAGFGLIIGGAIGNAIDRFLHGAVADFLSVSIPFIPLRLFNPWPAFNIADAAISIGVVIVLLDGLLPRGEKRI